MNTLYSVGLTGGIGSGKSTVSQFLQSWSVPVICADKIAHQLTQKGGVALPLIIKSFGADIIDATGNLNRSKLRTLVFQDCALKSRLEQIMHPLIRAQMWLEASQVMGPYVVYDIPLLIESVEQYQSELDTICVVDCDFETQVTRVLQRSSWQRQDVERVISSQASRSERLLKADVVIHNDGQTTLEQLKLQVLQCHQKWLESSQIKEKELI